MKPGIADTNLENLGRPTRGKVRDIYDLDDKLLVVTTDRISAFDVVMSEPVPGKGVNLNQMTLFWLRTTEDIVRNHLITADVNKYPSVCDQYKKIIKGRSMLVRKAKPLPIECIVRGYISGTGWKDYQANNGYVCGIKLPNGLVESQKLPQPILTPSTKAAAGQHDQNITKEEAIKLAGEKIYEQVEILSIKIYKKAEQLALKKGIIIADTKMEFGIIDNELILIDELLTPDASRFWPLDSYQIGSTPPSFDKQYLRDYLTSTGWNKQPPPPPLPAEVIENTRLKYEEALKRLTS